MHLTYIAAAPTEIYTADQLNDVRNNLAGSYILMSDIDLGNSVWGEVYAGGGWEPIGTSAANFTGTFDGNGYSISGLFINRPGTSYIGLLGYVNSADIQNMWLEDVSVTGRNTVGGLVGYINNSSITDSCVTGSVTGLSTVGGLVGYINISSITDSYVIGTVDGTNTVGGLVGKNNDGSSVNKSYTNVAVTGSEYYIGGLVGENNGGSSVNNSYATGAVNGNSRVGGLVGQNHTSNVSYSYSTGNVTGASLVGGFMGYKYSGIVASSYYNTCTAIQSDNSGKGIQRLQRKWCRKTPSVLGFYKHMGNK